MGSESWENSSQHECDDQYNTIGLISTLEEIFSQDINTPHVECMTI